MPYQIQTRSRRVPVAALTPSAFSSFGEVIQNPSTHQGQPALETVEANQGTATKWLDVTKLQSLYDASVSQKPAETVMNMFVCRPRTLKEGRLFNVGILERHPYTPQTFVPMGLGKGDMETAYLVIVAPTLPFDAWREQSTERSLQPYQRKLRRPEQGSKARLTNARAGLPRAHPGFGPPDLENVKAFIVRGDQAVTYGAGTWHAPMVVLGEREVEFVVVQYANGVGEEDCQEVEMEIEGRGVGVEVDVGEGGAVDSSAATTAKL